MIQESFMVRKLCFKRCDAKTIWRAAIGVYENLARDHELHASTDPRNVAYLRLRFTCIAMPPPKQLVLFPNELQIAFS